MRHKRKFLKNKKGNNKYVVLPVEDYRKMLALLEELEDIKTYDSIVSKKIEYEKAEKVFSNIEMKTNV